MISPEKTDEERQAEREMRTAIRRQVISMGVPAQKASEIVDLAFHGAQKAMEALTLAANVSTDPRVKLNAMLLASSLIDEKMKGMREIAQTLAPAAGLNLMSATVQVGGQPS